VLPLPASQHRNIVCNPGGVHIRPSLAEVAIFNNRPEHLCISADAKSGKGQRGQRDFREVRLLQIMANLLCKKTLNNR
jgi:hypothetical protein